MLVHQKFAMHLRMSGYVSTLTVKYYYLISDYVRFLNTQTLNNTHHGPFSLHRLSLQKEKQSQKHSEQLNHHACL